MESILSEIMKFDTLINTLFIILIIFILVLYINSQAGSAYSVLNRLWHLFFQKNEFYDAKLAEFWQERNDVEHFNMLFNVRAKNNNEINKFIIWQKKKNIDIVKISRAKRWFDFSLREAIVPFKTTTLFVFMLSIFFGFLFFSSIGVAVRPSALIKIEENDPWIWVNQEYAENYFPNINVFPFRWDYWRLTPNDCENPQFDKVYFSQSVHISEKSTGVLCSAFKSKEDIEKINNLIKKQKAFYWIALFPAFLMLFLFWGFMRRMFAFELINHIQLSRKNSS